MKKKNIAIICITAVIAAGSLALTSDPIASVNFSFDKITRSVGSINLSASVVSSSRKAAFMKKITGLWLNGCQDASWAKYVASHTGETDVSMTEFERNNGELYMSTYGDINGICGGDTVPDLYYGRVDFSYISSNLKKAEGKVNGMTIKFDLGDPYDQVIYYYCGGWYTHCAYTGFSSIYDMHDYFGIY